MKGQLFREELPLKGVGCAVLFMKVVWTILFFSQESDIIVCFSLSMKAYSCDYKRLKFFGILYKTVGLHTKLAYDDIDEHWTKFIYICKLFVVYKTHQPSELLSPETR